MRVGVGRGGVGGLSQVVSDSFENNLKTMEIVKNISFIVIQNLQINIFQNQKT